MKDLLEHCKNPRILFICKKRHIYSQSTSILASSGLLNSARFVVEMLNKAGIESKLIDVLDNNAIDKEVTQFKPSHVVIEALWVIPDKFEVLTKLHPKVKWIIRLHSEIPFLANEGIAMEWLYKYQKYKNVYIGANATRTVRDLNALFKKEVLYLPNYYPVGEYKDSDNFDGKRSTIDIACFGAIRPMKNQLMQAMAAIEFGECMDKKINFHINSTRIEGKGDPVLKNIENLFANNPKHKLITHEWLNHDEFIGLVRKMDIGMQVSFSETFNIVTADFVSNNIPVVVSPEIFWVLDVFQADPNSIESIVSKLKFVWKSKILGIQRLNKIKLKSYNSSSKDTWIELFS